MLLEEPGKEILKNTPFVKPNALGHKEGSENQSSITHISIYTTS